MILRYICILYIFFFGWTCSVASMHMVASVLMWFDVFSGGLFSMFLFSRTCRLFSSAIWWNLGSKKLFRMWFYVLYANATMTTIKWFIRIKTYKPDKVIGTIVIVTWHTHSGLKSNIFNQIHRGVFGLHITHVTHLILLSINFHQLSNKSAHVA